jgi:hypothetical protein
MAKISTYPQVAPPALSDMLIGTDSQDNSATKNFTVGDILGLVDFSTLYCLGKFGSTDLQSTGAVLDPTPVNFPNEIIIGKGVERVSPNAVSVDAPGVFMITLTARVVHGSGGGDAVVNFWTQKNSVDIPLSRQTFTIPNSHTQGIVYNFLIEMNANDFISVYWDTTNINATLSGSTGNPTAPSVLLNVYKVGV